MKDQTRRTFGALIVSLALLAPIFIASQTGCKTMPTVGEIATPERIAAVTALGAYYGSTAAIADGKRAAITSARDALTVIAASPTVDLPAVIAALDAAGVTFLESDDGTLTVGAVLVFADLWAGTAGKILDEPRIRAVIAGCVRGFDMALAAKKTKGISPANIAHTELVKEVESTRPSRTWRK